MIRVEEVYGGIYMKKIIFIFFVITKLCFANEDFFRAVENNKLKEVEIFLKKGINVNLKEQWFGKTALMLAATYNYEELTDLLIKNGANPDMQTKEGYTALMYAFSNNSHKSLKVLLNKKQNLDLKNKDGDGILHMATRNNLEELVKTLLEKGANIDIKDKDGNTPLILSILNKNENLIKLFSYRGADLTLSNNKGEKPIFIAINTRNLLMLKIFAESRVYLDEKDSYGNKPLYLAITLGDEEMVKIFLDAEVSLDYKDNKGNSYMHLNSIYGNREILDQLISKKMKINEKNLEGNTPLMIAAMNNKVDIVKRFLELGLSYEESNNYSKNSYMLAKENNAKDVMDFFGTIENDMMKAIITAIKEGKTSDVIRYLQRGIDINSTDLKGESILYKIIESQNISLIEHFLDNKVRVGTKELNKAIDTGNVELLRIFAEFGINLFPKVKFEESLVYRAIKNGDFVMSKYLIENSPNEYKSNKTILDLAVASQNDNIINYVLDKGFAINTLNKELLFWAIKNNKLDLCEKFLINTSNMSLKDKDSRSLLMASVIYDVSDIFDLLISKGGELHETDERGYTLLMLAAEHNSVKTGEKLIKENLSMEDAIYIAIENDSLDIIKLFGKKGLKLKTKDEKDMSYLMYAAKHNSVKTFEYLLEKKLDLDDKDKNGENALMYAARGGSIDIIKFLLDKGESKKIKNKNGENLLDVSKTIEVRNFLVSQGFK